ncbi:carboxypeptidase N subunit 2-like [Bradysia coprophila]|uniref:carboxypeptidase N subunit 2-like n=1 Tax=Bradysia coprophila TaxID=38358 RepID=UPI00187D961C|nr:carboxypeptidase N subunit 2-like [Bradysia coprophila]
MEQRLLLWILILTVSAKLVQTKMFLCKEKYETSQCTIQNVTAEESSIELESPYLSSQKMITGLTILRSSMDGIPPISSNRLVNLNYLRCDGLTDIEQHSFSLFNNVVRLEISHGTYTTFKENLFSSMPLLTEMHARDGTISEIEDDAFFNLTKLIQLNLSNNTIGRITPKMFKPLESLFALDLSYNQITCLDEDLFLNNINLTYLNLNDNKINILAARIFNPQSKLYIVNLSRNELTTLNTQNMVNIHAEHNQIRQLFISRTVEYLDVYRNHIEDVVCDEVDSHLTYLDMTNNSLTELGCIGSLKNLVTLRLNLNNFGIFKQSSFVALTELTLLQLGATNISMIENVVFTHQYNLQTLVISDNRMGNNALKVLPAWRNLLSLHVQGNNMTEFPYDTLKTALPRLSELGIGVNDFNCTFLERAVKKLNDENVFIVPTVAYKMRHQHSIAGIGCEETRKNGTAASGSLSST